MTTSNRTQNRKLFNWLLGATLLLVMGLYSLIVPTASPNAESATLVPQGRLFASNCAQCHGTNGQSGAIDQLAGDSAADTYNKLKDQQTHNSIMGSQARAYTDDELKAIAAYFASIPKQ